MTSSAQPQTDSRPLEASLNPGAAAHLPRSTDQAEARVRGLLEQVYGVARDAGDDAFVRAGMSVSELVRLYELVSANGCRSALEVGMATGTSSLAICAALGDNGGGRLASIDPFQSSASGYASAGVENLRKAGFEGAHRLIERPDYLALPELLAQGERFDFILIDGWHSFDFTLVDLFYADLLLRTGGVLAFHDTTAPQVYKAVRFLELHKPYERLSPPLARHTPSLVGKVARRVRTWLRGPAALAGAKERREKWRMLAAYRKQADSQVAEDHGTRF